MARRSQSYIKLNLIRGLAAVALAAASVSPVGIQPAAAQDGTPPPSGDSPAAQSLKQQGAELSYGPEGRVRAVHFGRAGAAGAFAAVQGFAPGAGTPADAARGFLNAYGSVFGLASGAADLAVESLRPSTAGQGAGQNFVKFQQTYQGIPVLGGELVVQTDAAGNVASATGEVSPALAIGTAPAIDAMTAGTKAVAFTARAEGTDATSLIASRPTLWIYDPSLLGPDKGPVQLVWRMDVSSTGLTPIRELVLVNAVSGSIALNFNQVDTGLAEGGVRSPHLAGSTFYVISSGGNDGNDCFAPGTACATINGAIAKASNGDTIKVASGTYSTNYVGAFPNTSLVYLDRNVTLLGGWTPAFDAQTGQSALSVAAILNYNGIYVAPSVTASMARFAEMNAPSYGLIVYGNLSFSSGSVVNNYKPAVIYSGQLSVADVTMDSNSSGVYSLGGTFAGLRSTFSNSTAGPGLMISGGSASLTNSTISSNYGSGVQINSGLGTVVLSNTTVADNGFAGLNNSASAANLILRNTIVGRNDWLDASVHRPDCYGSFTSQGYNLVEDLTGCTVTAQTGDQFGTSVSPINPHLGPLQNNGGLTANHALLANSPAIDAGNPATPGGGGAACEATDQRGTTRPTGPSCDIGAYEGSTTGVSFPLAQVYQANNSSTLPGSAGCNSSASCNVGYNIELRGAYNFAADTYNFYANNFGRDSIDDNGMVIISSVDYCPSGGPCPYPNAFWNGSQMVYGNSYASADDVVGHELTHGVTEHTSHLFYYYQSGAINESFSDVFGEFVDQTNGAGNDTPAVKWLTGEDLPIGAIRSMSNPPLYGDPDKMTSPLYFTGDSDRGGVHTNSGVNNKAAFLMTDGGTFNGKTVVGLGIPKVAHIYYEVQTNLLTSGADYLDLYNDLNQACINLVGQYGITANDCLQVQAVVDAVQMNMQPVANFNAEAPVCAAGQIGVNLWADDFEGGLGNWLTGANSGANDWMLDSTAILGGPNAHSGLHSLYSYDQSYISDTWAQMANGVTLSAGAYLHFYHEYSFDLPAGYLYSGNWDGGVLEYSTNAGSTWTDAGGLFDPTASPNNGYKGVLPGAYGNPLGGRSAFVGASHGYIASRYNLASLAGKTVQFRWRIGTDSSVDYYGWWLDDVRIYTCVPLPSALTVTAPANGALSNSYTPTLDWSDSTLAVTNYQVQIATDSLFTALVTDTNVPGSTYTVSPALTPDVTYYWRARGHNTVGDGPWTAVSSLHTALLPPTEPTGTNLPVAQTLRPAFDWGNVTGATSYNLQVSTTENFAAFVLNINVSPSAYVPTADLPRGTLLYWRARGNSAFGPGNWSPVQAFSSPNPPGTPVLSAPANNATLTGLTPTLSWAAAAFSPDHYEVQISTSSSFASVQRGLGGAVYSGTSYTPASSLAAATTYYWRVRAVGGDTPDGAAFSEWSAANMFKTP